MESRCSSNLSKQDRKSLIVPNVAGHASANASELELNKFLRVAQKRQAACPRPFLLAQAAEGCLEVSGKSAAHADRIAARSSLETTICTSLAWPQCLSSASARFPVSNSAYSSMMVSDSGAPRSARLLPFGPQSRARALLALRRNSKICDRALHTNGLVSPRGRLILELR
jgi:hypothetical protein